VSEKPRLGEGAREVARRVLRRVRCDGAYANLVLSAELTGTGPRLDPREAGLATELVYGVLRHRRRLDHALGRVCDRPLSRVEDDLLDVLRVAAYQLLLLDRVPAHAAVNDAVESVRLGRGKAPAGFVNAVLRKLKPACLDADLPDDALIRLAVSTSLPTWLARRWSRQLGPEEAKDLGLALLKRAPLTARLNPLRGSEEAANKALEAEGAALKTGRWVPGAVSFTGLANPFGATSYLEGRWTIQDEAAQLVAHLMAPEPGMTVLDACAGVGGKATHLAAHMENRGTVICLDRSERKLALLSEHCLRLGVTCCEARKGDLLDPGALDGVQAQRVLVDAPCSGLGVLRRHPELKWREPPDIEALARLQKEMLTRAAEAVAPGGELVFAVCTTTEEEGPAQLAWARQALPTLRPAPPPKQGPLADLATPDGAVALWPHRHGCDGFFMARFIKQR
jgi:16S rRNA (cytosine967-C5)-methyltransferase